MIIIRQFTKSTLAKISWSFFTGSNPDSTFSKRDGSASKKCGKVATIGTPMQLKRSSVPSNGQEPFLRQYPLSAAKCFKFLVNVGIGKPRINCFRSYSKPNETHIIRSKANIGSWMFISGGIKYPSVPTNWFASSVSHVDNWGLPSISTIRATSWIFFLPRNTVNLPLNESLYCRRNKIVFDFRARN